MYPSTSASPPSTSNHHFTTTLRGGLKLWQEGFSYVKQKTSNGSGHIRFSCCQRQNLHCRGFLVTTEDLKEILRSGPHNHVPVDQERGEQFPVEGWRELTEEQKMVLIEQVRMRPQLWMDVGKNLKNKKYWIDVAVMVLNTMELSAARICCNTFNILRQTMPHRYADRLFFLLEPPEKEENDNITAALASHDALLDYLKANADDSLDEPPLKKMKCELQDQDQYALSDSPSLQETFFSENQSTGLVAYGLKIVDIENQLERRGMSEDLEILRRKLDALLKEMEKKIADRDLPEQSSWMP
ncbi:hypothetical protein QR680_013650 [Steinernema hermaphroditum]|uniref:FLYWCH-type domain-containing protein n=1 Tax=Steinernema hermaphroditum TaxID=289476 RepID=A0AA39I7S6_9BILA|nr:hypothetical protein QR680_013650 [Steinernema hermaphroditum]